MCVFVWKETTSISVVGLSLSLTLTHTLSPSLSLSHTHTYTARGGERCCGAVHCADKVKAILCDSAVQTTLGGTCSFSQVEVPTLSKGQGLSQRAFCLMLWELIRICGIFKKMFLLLFLLLLLCVNMN